MSKIKKLREKSGLTQVKVAEILCVTQASVARWESGQIFPRTELLPKLAKILNCTVDELLSN